VGVTVDDRKKLEGVSCAEKQLKVTYRCTIEMDPRDLNTFDLPESYESVEKIKQRLAAGDVWAWARIRLVAKCGKYKAEEYRHNNYKNEAEFRSYDYLDMIADVLSDLGRQINAAVYEGERAKQLWTLLEQEYPVDSPKDCKILPRR